MDSELALEGTHGDWDYFPNDEPETLRYVLKAQFSFLLVQRWKSSEKPLLGQGRRHISARMPKPLFLHAKRNGLATNNARDLQGLAHLPRGG